MSGWRNILVAITIFGVVLAVACGCGGPAEPTAEPTSPPSYQPPTQPTLPPSPVAQDISDRIADTNPAESTALASLLGISQELDIAEGEGTISQDEGSELGEALDEKFSDCIRNQVDAIDPTDLAALNDFWKLQRVQALNEYNEHCDPETKQYKEEQEKQKFNDYIRNWVNHIDPNNLDEGLADIFFLQKIQNCAKYKLASVETDQYKHEQMGEKFNEWVRNAIDNLDPTDPDDLGEMVFLQKLQNTEKWKEYATPETAEYKHEQLEEKFNQWVRERVDELDPDDPNFEEDLEKLRAIQQIEKYKELVTPETRAYKESELKAKMGDYATSMVDDIMPGHVQGLAELINLQRSDIYQEFCPEGAKWYIDEQLWVKFTAEPGEPPRLIGVLPENEETEVDTNQPIILVFDQPMEPAYVAHLLNVFPTVDAELTWLDGNYIFVLEPIENLHFSTTYAFLLAHGAMSEGGLLLEEDHEFSFTTKDSGEPPKVTDTKPLDDQIDASVGQPIEISFDQPMDTSSVEAAITVEPVIDYVVYWQQNDTVVVIMPLTSLEFNTTYSVEISAGARSADGLPLDNGFSFQYITGIVPAPQVTGTLPFDGQDDIPANHPVVITFSWPMDPESVELALSVSPDLDYEIEWLETNFVMELKPLTTLANGTRYTLKIDEEAESSDGLPLGESFSFSFTTAG